MLFLAWLGWQVVKLMLVACGAWHGGVALHVLVCVYGAVCMCVVVLFALLLVGRLNLRVSLLIYTS